MNLLRIVLNILGFFGIAGLYLYLRLGQLNRYCPFCPLPTEFLEIQIITAFIWAGIIIAFIYFGQKLVVFLYRRKK